MLITFSGLDGAGKTTLIKTTLQHLNSRGFSTLHLTMYDDIGVYASIRRFRDRLMGNPQPDRLRSISAPSKNIQPSLAMKFIRSIAIKRIIFFLDLFVFIIIRFIVEILGRRILVLDRYFYDSLADFGAGMRDSILRFYVRRTPVPDLPVYVETSPETAFARKGEYSIAELTARRQRYKRLFNWIPGTFILINDDLSKTSANLKKELDARLNTHNA